MPVTFPVVFHESLERFEMKGGHTVGNTILLEAVDQTKAGAPLVDLGPIAIPTSVAKVMCTTIEDVRYIKTIRPNVVIGGELFNSRMLQRCFVAANAQKFDCAYAANVAKAIKEHAESTQPANLNPTTVEVAEGMLIVDGTTVTFEVIEMYLASVTADAPVEDELKCNQKIESVVIRHIPEMAEATTSMFVADVNGGSREYVSFDVAYMMEWLRHAEAPEPESGSDLIALFPVGIEVRNRQFIMNHGEISFDLIANHGHGRILIPGEDVVIHEHVVAFMKSIVHTVVPISETGKMDVDKYEEMFGCSVYSVYSTLHQYVETHPDDEVAKRTAASMKLTLDSAVDAKAEPVVHGTHDGSDSGTPWDPEMPEDEPTVYQVALAHVRLNTEGPFTKAMYKSETVRRLLAEAIHERDLLVYGSSGDLYDLKEVCGRVLDFTVQPNDTVTLSVIPFGPQGHQLVDALDGIGANLLEFCLSTIVSTIVSGVREILSTNAIYIALPTDISSAPLADQTDRMREAGATRKQVAEVLGAKSVTITNIDSDGKPTFAKRF